MSCVRDINVLIHTLSPDTSNAIPIFGQQLLSGKFGTVPNLLEYSGTCLHGTPWDSSLSVSLTEVFHHVHSSRHVTLTYTEQRAMPILYTLMSIQ